MNHSVIKHTLHYTALLMGGVAFLLGAVVLYGWYTHNPDLIPDNLISCDAKICLDP